MPRTIRVFVHTRAHDEKIEETGLDEYEAWVTGVPADGQANEELLDALASHLGVPVSLIKIKSGHKSRHKMIEIDD
jgi:uncharacterized protein YggU (UPF0235/DUF167 family)